MGQGSGLSPPPLRIPPMGSHEQDVPVPGGGVVEAGGCSSPCGWWWSLGGCSRNPPQKVQEKHASMHAYMHACMYASMHPCMRK